MNKEILKEFEEIIGIVPEVLEEFQEKTCMVCGQPSNKAPQVKKLRNLFLKVLQQKDKFYQDKFEECFDIKTGELIRVENSLDDLGFQDGFIACKKLAKNNWNNDKKPTEN